MSDAEPPVEPQADPPTDPLADPHMGAPQGTPGLTEPDLFRRETPGLRAGPAPWQRKWYDVIFESDTPSGKWFDLVLLVVIMLSILAVMLESVESISAEWGPQLATVEWVITLLFSLEFLARLACVRKPTRYTFSFFGIVDIVSLAPSYLALFFTGAHTLATIRTLRLLRVFRVLKLARHLTEARSLLFALRHTWPRITVFLTVIVCSIVILGTLMYLIEAGQGSGFTDIPTSVYWAIVTMTTVGYGDIAPVTPVGKCVAAMVMLLGYAIIIVPTGLFAAEVLQVQEGEKKRIATSAADADADARVCPACNAAGHAPDAAFCNRCGAGLS
ncbi:ion transporter [Pseudobythopirellula maris]|nr:ion transporter [Pseudobythopirellula maris]